MANLSTYTDISQTPGPDFARLAGNPVINVKTYGAKGDGTTNDSSAIASALAAASGTNSKCAFVFFPSGTYIVGSTVDIPLAFGLVGAGKGLTTIKAATNLNAPVVQSHLSSNGTSDPNGQQIYIGHLKIDGNKANQTSGTNRYGLYLSSNPDFSGQSSGDLDFDNHHYIENIRITNCKNTGLKQLYRSEIRLHYVWSDHHDGHGFEFDADMFVNQCVGSWNKGNGFYMDGSSLRLTCCKAFYNGAGGTIDGVNSGVGFALINGQGGISMAACEAQDNAGPGFAITGNRHTLAGCTADSNSSPSPGPASGGGSGVWAGLDLNGATYCNITGFTAYDRNYSGNSNQKVACNFRNTATKNYIQGTHSGTNGSTVNAATSGTTTGNTVSFIT